MDIDKLEAGRELDALVAEKVMKSIFYTKCLKSYKPWCGVEKCSPDCEQLKETRPYSTDIAAAWEMEEELERRELTGEYGYNLWFEVGELVDLNDETCNLHIFAVAHATPLQRCKAALKAVLGLGELERESEAEHDA